MPELKMNLSPSFSGTYACKLCSYMLNILSMKLLATDSSANLLAWVA